MPPKKTADFPCMAFKSNQDRCKSEAIGPSYRFCRKHIGYEEFTTNQYENLPICPGVCKMRYSPNIPDELCQKCQQPVVSDQSKDNSTVVLSWADKKLMNFYSYHSKIANNQTN